VQTAVEVLSRATSSSEVLTLNLTALIILGILKAAVVAFGLSGGSLLSSTNRSFQGRSSQGEAAGVSASDMTGGLCFLLFTSGDPEKISCVQRSACESPQSAKDLLSAAKMWKKMHAIINAVPYSDKYTELVEAVYSAVRVGEEGDNCAQFAW